MDGGAEAAAMDGGAETTATEGGAVGVELT